jgi:hypothetical protein
LYQKVVWDRKHYAAEIVRTWDANTRNLRRHIQSTFPGIHRGTNQVPIPLTVAERVYRAESDQDKESFQSLVSLLNHLEFVAIAYSRGVANRRVIDEALGRTLAQWFRGLDPFIAVYTKRAGRNPWEPFCHRVASSWLKKYEPLKATEESRETLAYRTPDRDLVMEDERTWDLDPREPE